MVLWKMEGEISVGRGARGFGYRVDNLAFETVVL